MKAKVKTIFDGQVYMPGEEIYDLGSFRCTGVDNDGIRSYVGLSADVSKLPHYVKTGSTALCLDTSSLYEFHQESDTWYAL